MGEPLFDIKIVLIKSHWYYFLLLLLFINYESTISDDSSRLLNAIELDREIIAGVFHQGFFSFSDGKFFHQFPK